MEYKITNNGNNLSIKNAATKIDNNLLNKNIVIDENNALNKSDVFNENIAIDKNNATKNENGLVNKNNVINKTNVVNENNFINKTTVETNYMNENSENKEIYENELNNIIKTIEENKVKKTDKLISDANNSKDNIKKDLNNNLKHTKPERVKSLLNLQDKNFESEDSTKSNQISEKLPFNLNKMSKGGKLIKEIGSLMDSVKTKIVAESVSLPIVNLENVKNESEKQIDKEKIELETKLLCLFERFGLEYKKVEKTTDVQKLTDLTFKFPVNEKLEKFNNELNVF